MKCILCGEESAKPICNNCTKKIRVENPLIATKSVWVGIGAYKAVRNFEIEDISKLKAYFKLLIYPEVPHITSEDLSLLNEVLKIEKSLEMDDEAYHYLSILLFKMHLHREHYLAPFEVEEDYYLSMAKNFIVKGLEINDENVNLYNWAIKVGEFEGNRKMIKEYSYKAYEKFGGRNYLIKLLEILEDEKSHNEIVKLCDEYLEKSPNDFEIVKKKAKAFMNMEKYEDAQLTFLKAIEIKNDDWESWYLRGVCLRRIGKYGGAIQSFQTAIAINPQHKESYKNLIEVLEEIGQKEKAEEFRKRMNERFGGG